MNNRKDTRKLVIMNLYLDCMEIGHWTSILIKNPSFFAALPGATTLKARALKEVWNIAAVLLAENGISVGFSAKGNSNGHSNSNYSGELALAENCLTPCSQELFAKGSQLLKRTRKCGN